MSAKIDRIIKIIVIVITIITITSVLWLILFLISSGTMFKSLRIQEINVRKQIANELSYLENYKPIFYYIEKFKQNNGCYPDKLPSHFRNITTDKLAGFDYRKLRCDYYNFRILPYQGPIEYYEPRILLNSHKNDDGVEDGLFENKYYYMVNNEWQAVHFEYVTRYSDNWNLIDMCLDDGGCWDYTRHRCSMNDSGYCIKNVNECIEQNGTWIDIQKYCELN